MKAKRIAGLLLTLSLTVTTAGTSVLPTFAQGPDGSIVVTEERLADNAAAELKDAAAYAKVSASFTAAWENLEGVNDEWEPEKSNTGGKGWGNHPWPNEWGADEEHWIEYDWDAADNWVDAEMTTDFANAQATDKYNTIDFKEISTKSIRLMFTLREGSGGTGILRWKVMSDISEDYILESELGALAPAAKVTSDFYLAPKSKSGYSVTWASDNDAIKIKDNYGIVTRGTQDVTVKLTATITDNSNVVTGSDGEKSVSKDFNVVVGKKTRTTTVSSVDFTKVHINDKFWSARQKKFICDVIPVGINKVETATGGIPNLKNAMLKNQGKEAGKYQGTVYFLDSDPYKMIEAMSYALQIDANKDQEIIDAQNNIKTKLAEWIPYIQGAQEADGYLDTYFTLDLSDETLACFPEDATREKFTDFSRHEMYVAGHFYEAAVAHYRATKDKSLLDVAVKNADLICATFGNEEGKKKAVPGHEVMSMTRIIYL